MKLNRVAKIIAGLFTVWPPLYMMLFMGFIAMSMNGNRALFDLFPVVMVAHMTTMLIIMGLLVFYVMHALKNQALETTPRLLWAVMFFVGGVIAMPIYYFLHVLPDRPSEPPPTAF